LLFFLSRPFVNLTFPSPYQQPFAATSACGRRFHRRHPPFAYRHCIMMSPLPDASSSWDDAMQPSSNLLPFTSDQICIHHF
jgi:hypothetical protein